MLGWVGSASTDIGASLLTALSATIWVSPDGLLALSAAVLAALVTAVLVHHLARPAAQLAPVRLRPDVASRRRATCRTYTVLSDPNAPGRPRPRAPGR